MSSFRACPVDLLDNGNDSSGNIIQVEDGWRGIEATCVEIVGIHHGNLGE
jgi:hypothetical protein